MRKKFVCFLWACFVLAACAAGAFFAAIARGWIGYVPPLSELQTPISRFASQVVSADGVLLGTWSRSENRIFVDYDEISPHVFRALVATEDVRFFRHSGIDARALGRAVVKRGLFGDKGAGGGSTITQQLAKQLYSSTAASPAERLLQKPIEWVIAVELERQYTKEEILTLYLNYFDFLHGAVGIKTAAATYFGKLPRDLSLNEAATLVGMCKNPSFFNPVRFPERCRQRRNVVLGQMAKAGFLTEAERQALSTEPLTLNFHRADHKEGSATYLREMLRRVLMARRPQREDYHEWQAGQFYEDSVAWERDPLYGWCNKNFKRDGSPYNIYTDGLKIRTTVDSRMQRYAEESVRGHVAFYLQPLFERQRRGSATFPFTDALTPAQVAAIMDKAMRLSDRYRAMKAAGAGEAEIRQAFDTPTAMTVYSYHGDVDTVMTPMDSIRYYKSFLRAAFFSMDPANGHVKAYVGGLDYTHFQYDMCTSGRRQVGSTIKPFLYALAMQDGLTPCDELMNAQRTYYVAGRPWTPRNSGHARYGEMVTLKWGLSRSNNWISAALMQAIDPTGQRLAALLHEFGVMNRDIHPSMALCLGPCDISVAEMASAYTAFVNRGIRCAPLFVTRIEDREGNVLAEFQPRMNEVISEESSYKMIDMLRAVVDGGTAGRLRFKYHLDAPMGGKTGTTNRNSDGWFVGFTPRLVSACWVGGEDRDIHFNSMAIGQGASSALPIWAYYMTKVYRDKSLGYRKDEAFNIPSGFDPCASAAPPGALPDSTATAPPAASPPGVDGIFD
ncbi:MAG TPA: transglycosylase domain-containing protein [Candidatus Caccomonas pullistercoris]|nr:transglycosylase domain-containing protein [Candidatus Caccomonas pullistercoris]